MSYIDMINHIDISMELLKNKQYFKRSFFANVFNICGSMEALAYKEKLFAQDPGGGDYWVGIVRGALMGFGFIREKVRIRET